MEMAKYAEQSFFKAQGIFSTPNRVMPNSSDDVKRWVENSIWRLKSLEEGLLSVSVGGAQIAKALGQLDDKLDAIKKKLGIP